MISTPPPRLDAERTSFIGREADLARLEGPEARTARLITLHGPPGIGKTRLARELVLRKQRSFDGGVWFCDLTEARGPDDVMAVVARELGVPLTLGNDPDQLRGQLASAIAARGEVLLLLDNFEHVVRHAAETVGRWMKAAPRARFVVTSRELLRLQGEFRHELEPLEERDALALFTDRARAVRSEWAPTGDEAEAARSLVVRLDGIALAIELAAARMEVLSATQLVERIAPSLDLLASDRRDVPSRHATLREAIAWSWELLPRWERDALVQSTVFRGGFSLEAAEAVFDLGEGAPLVLDVVQALRAKSLLRLAESTVASTRVRVRLYECIREFAVERADDAGGAAEAEARHAAFYLATAERLAAAEHGPAEAQALDALACDVDNLLEVFRRNVDKAPELAARVALALDPLLSTRGPFDLQLSLFERALAGLDEGRSPALVASLLRAYGEALSLRGRLGDAAAVLERGLGVARAAGAAAVEARILCVLASNDRVQGRLDDVRLHAEQALAIFRRIGDRRGEGIGQTTVGLAHQAAARTAEALAAHQEALAIHREVKNVRFEAIAMGRLGNVAYGRGDLETALASFERALELQRTVGDRRLQAVQRTNAGGIQHDLEHYDASRRSLEDAIRVSREVGDRATEAVAQTFLGSLLLELGEGVDATSALVASVRIHEEVQNVAYHGLALRFLGHHHLESGATAEAERCFLEAARLGHAAADVEGEGIARAYLGVLAQLASDVERARTEFAAARDLVATAHDPRSRTVVAALQQVLAERGDTAAASDGAATARRSADTRLAMRLVEVLRARVAKEAPAATSLRVATDGRWFEVDAGGAVDLARRRPLRRILVRLTEQHLAAPGKELSASELIAAGWPGERLLADAGSRRLRTAIWTLRRMGLQGLVRASAYGYLIDSRAQVAWAEV